MSGWYDGLSAREKDEIDRMDREEAEVRERSWWDNYLSDYYGKVEAPLYEACDEDEDPEWDDKPRWVVYPDDTEEEGGAWLEPHVQRGDA